MKQNLWDHLSSGPSPTHSRPSTRKGQAFRRQMSSSDSWWFLVAALLCSICHYGVTNGVAESSNHLLFVAVEAGSLISGVSQSHPRTHCESSHASSSSWWSLACRSISATSASISRPPPFLLVCGLCGSSYKVTLYWRRPHPTPVSSHHTRWPLQST